MSTNPREAILAIIESVAPDADLAGLDPREDLRDALDLDSMDFLNVVIGIHERLGVEIPERDYRDVRTLDGLIEYVNGHTPR